MGKYEDIKSYLMTEAIKPESRRKMPSVRELMRKFSASQSPVTRALNDLKKIGLIDSKHGIGTVSTGHIKEVIIKDPFEDNTENCILHIVFDYYTENIWNMEHRLAACATLQGINIKTIRYQQDTNLLNLLYSCCDNRKFKGLILSIDRTWLIPALFSFIRDINIPTVFLDSMFDSQQLPKNAAVLYTNTMQMGILAIEYLHSRQVKNVAMIRSESNGEGSKILWCSLKKTALMHGIRTNLFSTDIRAWEDSMAAAAKITDEKLSEIRDTKIEALLYTSVAGAFAGQSILQKAGYRIPEDISVIAGGDMRAAQYCFPPITVLLADYEQMCIDAIELISGQKHWQKELSYDHKLIERNSVK